MRWGLNDLWVDADRSFHVDGKIGEYPPYIDAESPFGIRTELRMTNS
jgi:hypothetical protein